MMSCCIEHGFRERRRIAFMFIVNVLLLPFIKLVKPVHKDGCVFYRIHEVGSMGSCITLGFPKGT